MSFEFELSERERASAKFMSFVHRVLRREVVNAAKVQGITRAEVARRLETDRSSITRALNGTSNLTIRTISDLCWALEIEPDFDARSQEIIVGANCKAGTTNKHFERFSWAGKQSKPTTANINLRSDSSNSFLVGSKARVHAEFANAD